MNLNTIIKQKEEWYEMRKYATRRIWEAYYRAIEKQTLSMMDTSNVHYNLTEEEKTALMIFDTKEFEVSRREACLRLQK